MAAYGVAKLEKGPFMTVTHRKTYQVVPPHADSFDEHGVAWKDIQLCCAFTQPWQDNDMDIDHGVQQVSTRIYLPNPNPNSKSSLSSPDEAIKLYTTGSVKKPTKLPVVLYFHGGGFLATYASFKPYHNFLHMVCRRNRVMVIAPNYPLAPEFSFPAAHASALKTLMWLQSQAWMSEAAAFHCHTNSNSNADESESDYATRKLDPWIGTFSDLSRCILMGDCSGGNLSYYLMMWSSLISPKIESPLHIIGQVLIQPMFGGEKPTNSEYNFNYRQGLSALTDWLWSNCFFCNENPSGRDNALANPMVAMSSFCDQDLQDLFPPTLFVLTSEDPMRDRAFLLSQELSSKSKKVSLVYYEGPSHGFILRQQKYPDRFMDDLNHFFQNVMVAESSELMQVTSKL